MPIYNYECSTCGNESEHILSISKMSEPCEKPCEKCDGEIKKVIKEAPILGYNTKTPKMKTSDSFNSRLKDIHKTRGKESMMGNSIK